MLQQPLRKNPVTGVIEQLSSRPPSTFSAGARPPVSSNGMARSFEVGQERGQQADRRQEGADLVHKADAGQVGQLAQDRRVQMRDVQAALDHSGLAAEALVLEVTESALIADLQGSVVLEGLLRCRPGWV